MMTLTMSMSSNITVAAPMADPNVSNSGKALPREKLPTRIEMKIYTHTHTHIYTFTDRERLKKNDEGLTVAVKK